MISYSNNAFSGANAYTAPMTYWANTSGEVSGNVMEISVESEFVNDDVAAVRLDIIIPGVFDGEVEGIAKRDPLDKPNQELALKMAYGRAFESLSRKLLRQANGLVRQQDNEREQKAFQRAANTKKAKKAAKK